MSSAIEVLKKYSTSCSVCKYDGGNQCKASGGEFNECKPADDFYKAIQEAIVALEQKEKLSKWLDDVEGFETKEFRDTLEKSLFGKLVGTCKVREIMNLKKERVGEQK